MCDVILYAVPMYKIVDWSVSSLDNDTFVLSGRIQDFDENDCPQVKYMVNGEEKCFQVTIQDFIDFFQKAPIALRWLSDTRNILWANDADLAFLGYSADEVIGHNVMEVRTVSK